MEWIFMVIAFIASGVFWQGFNEEMMGKILLFAGICIAAFNLIAFIIPIAIYVSTGISIISVFAILVFVFKKLFKK